MSSFPADHNHHLHRHTKNCGDYEEVQLRTNCDFQGKQMDFKGKRHTWMLFESMPKYAEISANSSSVLITISIITCLLASAFIQKDSHSRSATCFMPRIINPPRAHLLRFENNHLYSTADRALDDSLRRGRPSTTS